MKALEEEASEKRSEPGEFFRPARRRPQMKHEDGQAEQSDNDEPDRGRDG